MLRQNLTQSKGKGKREKGRWDRTRSAPSSLFHLPFSPRRVKEETRETRLIPGPKRASITEHGSLNPTLPEGAYHMKRLTLIALAVVLALAISAWAPAPAAAQTPIQRGRTLDLLFYSTAGSTTLSFGATYPFSFILDGTLNYTSGGGTSVVDLGARYWFPVRPAGLATYVGAGARFASGATGFFIVRC